MSPLRPPAPQARTADVDRRLKRVEQRRGDMPTGGWEHQETFSFAGQLEASESGRWYPRHNCTLIEVPVTLDTAGTSNTVVSVRVNGVEVSTITLGSGDEQALGLFGEELTADVDYVTLAITTVGTGAENLVAQARTA